ncbi:hypothetical protein [Aeromicrobium terrae]|uniref:Uncharacterized protein n=1 Tax=Aeromicrobium terrae TaxID=2498846 RepID=A0A5C8NN87_9ACTN|nr:hypothetical protein [Aeromicrobium terrae]TXL63284.1 hypothetical protein FHP06_03395 [Aeromicrobium terrae]
MNTRLTTSITAAAAGLGLAAFPFTSAVAGPAPKATGGVAWSTALDYPATADFVAMGTSPVRGSITCDPGSLPQALMTANQQLTGGNLVVH